MNTNKKVLINKMFRGCSLLALSLVGIISCSDEELTENPGGIIAPESFFNNVVKMVSFLKIAFSNYELKFRTEMNKWPHCFLTTVN